MHAVISLRKDKSGFVGDEYNRRILANESGALCNNLAGTFASPTFEIILIVQVKIIPVA